MRVSASSTSKAIGHGGIGYISELAQLPVRLLVPSLSSREDSQ